MKKYIVTLTKDEREILSALTSKGKHKSQKILNALILLGCDEGEYQIKRSTNEEIAHILNISMRKIDRVKERFISEGIEVALNGRKRNRIYDKKADGDFEAHLVGGLDDQDFGVPLIVLTVIFTFALLSPEGSEKFIKYLESKEVYYSKRWKIFYLVSISTLTIMFALILYFKRPI